MAPDAVLIAVKIPQDRPRHVKVLHESENNHRDGQCCVKPGPFFSTGEDAMPKWNAKDSLRLPAQKNTVIHVNFESSARACQKTKIPNVRSAFNVQDNDDIDQILNKLREEMSKLW